MSNCADPYQVILWKKENQDTEPTPLPFRVIPWLSEHCTAGKPSKSYFMMCFVLRLGYWGTNVGMITFQKQFLAMHLPSFHHADSLRTSDPRRAGSTK